MLRQREEVLQLLRQKLLKAQQKMKHTVDTRRRPQEFNIGDWVLVKLRPHRQVSASETTYSKLTKRYYGPFEVQERLGKVMYRLKLTAHSRIHPVFHVSLLKAFVGDPEAAHADPLTVMRTEEATNTPLTIIDSKLVPADNGTRRMVLVQ